MPLPATTVRALTESCRLLEWQLLTVGHTPINCGKIPSPAVALYGIVNRIPAIMVTGSHIPADRNGIKFNKPAGEILKEDEAGIRNQSVSTDDSLFSEAASFALPIRDEWTLSNAARDMYVARYLDVFPNDCLIGQANCRLPTLSRRTRYYHGDLQGSWSQCGGYRPV